MSGSEPARPRLTVLSGPAGVGKSSVVSYLRTHAPQVWHSVSVTTRHPRPGEVDGTSYHFVSRDRFEALARSGELLEHAEYAGNAYGTPRAALTAQLAAGVPVLLEVDVQGARQVRASMPETRLVFLAPPSWDELERRLRGRGTENPEVVATRLARAEAELAAEPEFDTTVVATSIEGAAQAVLALVTAG